jgi:hypothetical protein
MAHGTGPHGWAWAPGRADAPPPIPLLAWRCLPTVTPPPHPHPPPPTPLSSLSGATADHLRAFRDAPAEDFLHAASLEAECPFTWPSLLSPRYFWSPAPSPVPAPAHSRARRRCPTRRWQRPRWWPRRAAASCAQSTSEPSAAGQHVRVRAVARRGFRREPFPLLRPSLLLRLSPSFTLHFSCVLPPPSPSLLLRPSPSFTLHSSCVLSPPSPFTSLASFPPSVRFHSSRRAAQLPVRRRHPHRPAPLRGSPPHPHFPSLPWKCSETVAAHPWHPWGRGACGAQRVREVCAGTGAGGGGVGAGACGGDGGHAGARGGSRAGAGGAHAGAADQAQQVRICMMKRVQACARLLNVK